jgi:hypothetical protein
MSIYNPHHANAAEVFKAAIFWRDRSLLADGSVFSGEALWTVPLLESASGERHLAGDGLS